MPPKVKPPVIDVQQYAIFSRRGDFALLTLSRSETFNALTLDTIRALSAMLQDCAADGTVKAVLISADNRSFSSGADMKLLYEALNQPRNTLSRDYYRETALLARQLRNFPKPVVALIDGLTIGDGALLGLHASHRVVTTGAHFAFPETALGFFPCAGLSHVLAHTPGMLGRYLALSGVEIGAGDCLHAGLATHCVAPAQTAELVESLTTFPLQEDGAFDDVSRRIEHFAVTAESTLLARQKDSINACFAAESLEEIMALLATRDGEWHVKTLKEMSKKSPTAQKIALRLLRAGRHLSFDDALRLEFRVSQHVVQSSDYREGLRAAIIDKDRQPQWRPDFPESVAISDVDACFAMLPEGELRFS